VFPVRYELGFYIPHDGDGILHSHRRESVKYSLLAVVESFDTVWLLIQPLNKLQKIAPRALERKYTLSQSVILEYRPTDM
jgi:hypothetical protein